MKSVFAVIALVLFFGATIVRAQSPVMYGLTILGGVDTLYGNPNGYGTLFKFDPANNKDNVICSFGKTNEENEPWGSLVYDSNNGLYYGMTFYGGIYSSGGTIFSFNPATNKDSVVWSFGGGTDGNGPYGNLVYDASNELFYGMTHAGGTNAGGTIFSFNPAKDSEKVLYNFGAVDDGADPQGNLVYDSINSLFYGMTGEGGFYSDGNIFSLDPSTGHYTQLYSFNAPSDGRAPIGSLIYDSGKSLFYGMTSQGGSYSEGTIISFNPSKNTDSVLWNFGNGTDGKAPSGDFIYNDSSGLFYGMTNYGGINGGGTIISFDPSSDKESVVWNFGNGTDGSKPYADLVYYSNNGLYYGMTTLGGSDDEGTIFTFNPANNKESEIWSFTHGKGEGYEPFGSLVIYNPDTTTGINTFGTVPASINLYPNPTDNIFTISGLRNGQIVEVYNYLGQKISNKIATNSIQQINICNQSDGIYFVRILNVEGNIAGERKVVKVN